MLSLLVALVVALVFVVVVSVAARRGHWADAVAVPDDLAGAAPSMAREARWRMALSLAVFVVVAFVITTNAFALQPSSWLGVGQSLGPGIGAILALVPFLLPTTAADAPGPVRTAELAVRRGTGFGPRWGFQLPIASGVLLLVFLAAAGLSSAADEFGRFREVSAALVASSAGGGADSYDYVGTAYEPSTALNFATSGPYPGWFYGVPLAVVTVVLAGVVVLALRRIAAAPRPPVEALFPLDDALRRASTRFVMLLSTAALLLYFGAVAFFAGRATSGVATVVDLKAGIDPTTTSLDQLEYTSSYLQPLFAIGVAETVIGVIFVLVSLVLLVASGVVASARWAPSGRASSVPGAPA